MDQHVEHPHVEHPRVEHPRRRLGATIGLVIFTGLGALVTLFVAVDWLQGLDTWFWEQTTCTIETSAVAGEPEQGHHQLTLAYRYRFRGESFTGDAVRHDFSGAESVAEAHRLAARYPEGSTVPCRVDPDEPGRAYLERANLWRGLMIFIPLLFVAVGGGFLWLLHGQPGSAEGDGSTERSGSMMTPLKVSVMLTMLFGCFFLFGFGMFVPLFLWPTWQVVEARSWDPVPCEVLSSGVRSHPGDESTTYSVEVLYRYEVDGREYLSERYRFMGGSSSGYEAKAEAVAAIPAGAVTECWADPEDPWEAVLERGFGADYLFGAIPLLFGVIGAGGLWFVHGLTRGARRTAAGPSWSPGAARRAALTPGPVVLEPTFGPFGKLGLAILVAVLWNSVVAVFLWHLVGEWRAGRPDWLLALFTTPFALIGLLLASGIPYSLLALVNPRPRLRLSPGVLRAGSPAQLEWSFRGAAGRIRSLRIWLEGSRRTTTTTDTSISIRTDTFRTVELLERSGHDAQFGSASIVPPPGLEPTTEGPRAVTWKLKLQGAIDNWPDVADEFEVRVGNPLGGPGRRRRRGGHE